MKKVLIALMFAAMMLNGYAYSQTTCSEVVKKDCLDKTETIEEFTACIQQKWPECMTECIITCATDCPDEMDWQSCKDNCFTNCR